mmetsp:Transcript_36538/g.68059  ORF Transcript_36538/g.68059 Transcript_36538/m.68059 type:complete len:300 (+) Transcript_36538:80-979(+)
MGNKFGMTAAMKIDVDFNLNGIEPTGVHASTIESSLHHLSEARNLLKDLVNYHGNGESIRVALSNSQDVDLQRESFSNLCPNIDVIARFHRLSVDIATDAASLANELITVENVKENLTYVKLLGEILLFAFEFDQMKMMKPEIQNDFSFYRRSLGSAATGGDALPLPSDEANVVSMWLAGSLPMMGSICAALASESVVLVHMTHVAFGMLVRKSVESSEEKVKLVNLMIISTIMYDRVCGVPGGVFTSSSAIKVKKCIQVMKRDGGNRAQQLAQCIKYSTIHYNDNSTPKSIKNDLDRL